MFFTLPKSLKDITNYLMHYTLEIYARKDNERGCKLLEAAANIADEGADT